MALERFRWCGSRAPGARRLALLLCVPLALPACTRDQDSHVPEARSQAAPEREDDGGGGLQAAAGALAGSYRALADGDLEGAAEAFAPDVVWQVRRADTQIVRGRAQLVSYFRERRTADSRDVGLARIFAAGDDLLIAQGRFVDHEGGRMRVTGFVAFAQVAGGRITEVLEHLAPAQIETTDPRLPGDPELVQEDSDPVRQTMAETLDDAWSSGDWGRIDNMFASDFDYHNLGAGIESRGLASYRALFERRAAPFPDISFEIVSSWSTGQWVILDKRIRGTHTAPLDDLPPTGRSFEITAVDVLRFAGDEIVEIWSYYDPSAIRAQIEPAPQPED